jgi:hypothetical protein
MGRVDDQRLVHDHHGSGTHSGAVAAERGHRVVLEGTAADAVDVIPADPGLDELLSKGSRDVESLAAEIRVCRDMALETRPKGSLDHVVADLVAVAADPRSDDRA